MTNCFNTLKINFFNPIVDSSEFKNEKLLESDSSKGILESRYNLGSYLAGLIEGDGSIIIPKSLRNDKGKLLYPKIKITFVSKDAPLAIKIKKVLGAGTLEYPKNTDYLNLLIQDIPTLYKITVIINGKMRTPKIEALHRLV